MKEFAGHKFVLKVILCSLSFRSITFCWGRMGSCFETGSAAAGEFLTNVGWLNLWVWINLVWVFLMVEAWPFQKNIVHGLRCQRIFLTALWCAQTKPDLLGRLMLPCFFLLQNRTTLNPCLSLGRCTYFHPWFDWAQELSGLGPLKRQAEKRLKSKTVPVWVSFVGKDCLCQSVSNMLVYFCLCEGELKTQIPTLKTKAVHSVWATSKSPTLWCQNCTCSSAADLSTKYITCQLLELGSWGEGNH